MLLLLYVRWGFEFVVILGLWALEFVASLANRFSGKKVSWFESHLGLSVFSLNSLSA